MSDDYPALSGSEIEERDFGYGYKTAPDEEVLSIARDISIRHKGILDRLEREEQREKADEVRHCDGCGEDYDPQEESHAGHEYDNPTVLEALRDVHRRFCIPDMHDPACKVLHENLAGRDSATKYRVTFWRHGGEDWIVFDTRRDAEAFVTWGQTEGSAFIDAKICVVPW